MVRPYGADMDRTVEGASILICYHALRAPPFGQ